MDRLDGAGKTAMMIMLIMISMISMIIIGVGQHHVVVMANG